MKTTIIVLLALFAIACEDKTESLVSSTQERTELWDHPTWPGGVKMKCVTVEFKKPNDGMPYAMLPWTSCTPAD